MDFKDDTIGEVGIRLPSPPLLPPYHSVEECRKDHFWRYQTQMAAKPREYFSKLDHDHQAQKTKLFVTPAVKIEINLSIDSSFTNEN